MRRALYRNQLIVSPPNKRPNVYEVIRGHDRTSAAFRRVKSEQIGNFPLRKIVDTEKVPRHPESKT